MPQPRSLKRSSAAPPVRRLKSPAERFGAPEIEVEADFKPAAAPRLASTGAARAPSIEPVESTATENPQSNPTEANPDPFQPLPGAPSKAPRADKSRGARRGAAAAARATAARSAVARRANPHAPRPHEKRPHQVAHLPVNPAPAAPPDRPNSMTRALVARKKARVRRIVARVVGVAAALFVVQCGVAALTAPQFAIKSVEVRGLDATPATAVEKLSSTLVGQNIFRARAAAVAQKVSALPTVAQARVVRPLQWPPRLRLEVTERQPILRVGAGQSWWVADAAGVPYRRARQGDEALYALTAPQFTPQTGQALPAADWQRARELARDLAADNALVAQAAPAVQGQKNAPQFWQLRRIYFDRDGFAAVRVSGSGALGAHRELLIRLGEEDWPAKLAQARMALNYFERTGQRARELDLVSGEHPRWRPLAQVAKSQDLTAKAG